MVIKVCKVCGREFEAKGRAVTCSPECRDINRKANVRKADAKRKGKRNDYFKSYNESHKDERKSWRIANSEHLREYQRNWRIANSEHLREYQRNWRIAQGDAMYSRYRGNYIRRHARTLARVRVMNARLEANDMAGKYRVARGSGGLGIEFIMGSEEDYVQSYDSLDDVFNF